MLKSCNKKCAEISELTAKMNNLFGLVVNLLVLYFKCFPDKLDTDSFLTMHKWFAVSISVIYWENLFFSDPLSGVERKILQEIWRESIKILWKNKQFSCDICLNSGDRILYQSRIDKDEVFSPILSLSSCMAWS